MLKFRTVSFTLQESGPNEYCSTTGSNKNGFQHKFGKRLKRNYETYNPFQSSGHYRIARSKSDISSGDVLSTHADERHSEVRARGLSGLENLCESCENSVDSAKCRQSHSVVLRKPRSPLFDPDANSNSTDSPAKLREKVSQRPASLLPRYRGRTSVDYRSSDLRKLSSSKEDLDKSESARFSRQPVLRGPSTRDKTKQAHRRSVPNFVCLTAHIGDLTGIGRSCESLIAESVKEENSGTMAGSEVNLCSMQPMLPGLHLGQLPSHQRKHSLFQESKNWHTIEDTSPGGTHSALSTPKPGSVPSGSLYSTTAGLDDKNFITVEFLDSGDQTQNGDQNSSSNVQKFESTEVVPALQKVVVRELLTGPLEKRGLTMERVEVFLEGSSTPLPLSAPAHCLGGQKIFIKVRENSEIKKKSTASNIQTERRPSGIQIPRQFTGLTHRAKGKQQTTPTASSTTLPPGMPGTSTNHSHQSSDSPPNEDSGDVGAPQNLSQSFAGTGRVRGGPGRISIFFGKEKAEMLSKLHQFRQDGVSAAVDSGLVNLLPALDIPDHWTKIVANPEGLTRKHSEQQMALWELVVTEQNYIQMLGMLSDVRNYLVRLQADGFMTDVDAGLVFRNIEEVFRGNFQYFWMEGIQPLLKHSQKTGEPMDPVLMSKGFTEMERWFEPYITFCLDHLQMVYYIQKKQKENELFREFIGWVQSLESLRRLQLKDILVSPMQRLTKYPLLLKAVHKNTADMAGREAIAAMIEQAEKATNRLNFEFSHKQQYEILQRVMQCIESYDAVEAANEEIDKLLKQHGHFVDLTAPMPYCRNRMMRKLWRRGDMKLRDGYTKTETMCYLFTDMFLVCKQIGRKGDRPRVKIIRPPYHIDRIVVKDLSETVGFAFLYMNEFCVPSAAYAFQTSTSDEALKWLEMFQMAREEYHRSLDADEGAPLRRRGQPFELTPSASASSIGSHKTGAPHRRVSIGSILDHQKTMSVKKDTETENSRIDSTPVQNGVSHRKSSSMDSTVVAANYANSIKERRNSHDDLLLEEQIPMNLNIAKLKNRDNEGYMNMKDSHSSINLRMATESEDHGSRRQSLKPSNGSSDSEEGFRNRPRSNSMEVLGKFFPARLQRARSRSRSRSPTPPPTEERERPQSARPATTCLTSNSFKYPEEMKEALSPKLTRKLSAPMRGSLSRSENTSSETLVAEDLNQSQQQSSIPSSPATEKRRVPSPIFGIRRTHSGRNKKGSEAEKYTNSTDLTLTNGHGKVQEVNGDPTEVSSQNSVQDTERQSDGVQTHPGSTPSHRRQERRYHTADSIEAFKPKSTTYPAGILKRFSWNISSAVSQMSRKPNAKTTTDPANWRKNSSSTMSSESFCSSSGVSSSSSQLCVNEEVTEETGDATPSVTEKTEEPLAGFVHVSTVTVNEQHSEMDDQHQGTLKINLINQVSIQSEFSESPSSPPPLPDNPPPICVPEKCDIPTIETQEPTPLTTPVLTPSSTDLMDLLSQEEDMANAFLDEDLDREILDEEDILTPVCSEEKQISPPHLEVSGPEESEPEPELQFAESNNNFEEETVEDVVAKPENGDIETCKTSGESENKTVEKESLRKKESVSRIPQLSGTPRKVKVTHKELMQLIQKGDLETSDV